MMVSSGYAEKMESVLTKFISAVQWKRKMGENEACELDLMTSIILSSSINLWKAKTCGDE